MAAGNPMGGMPPEQDNMDDPNAGDPLAQEVEDLEARVSVIEQQLGISSPPDEAESGQPPAASGAMPMMPKAPKKGGKASFFG